MNELKPHEIRKIKHIATVAEQLASQITSPIDPKVEALFLIIADLLNEQVQENKVYEWSNENIENPDGKYLFLDNDDDLPSAEKLEEWFK